MEPQAMEYDATTKSPGFGTVMHIEVISTDLPFLEIFEKFCFVSLTHLTFKSFNLFTLR